MLHMVRQVQYVEGLLWGVVGIDPVFKEGVFARADSSGIKQLSQGSAEEAKKDGIRG